MTPEIVRALNKKINSIENSMLPPVTYHTTHTNEVNYGGIRTVYKMGDNLVVVDHQGQKHTIEDVKGLQGEQGIPGINGKDGLDGKDGKDGLQGPQGVQGEMGPQGIQGLKGDKGDRGEKGQKGDRGPKGEKGEPGPAGKTGGGSGLKRSTIQGMINTSLPSSTDSLPEGTTNLYYTDERVDDRVSNLFTAGQGIEGSYDDLGNNYTISADINTTNLKFTSGEINTTQDISTSSSPDFSGATFDAGGLVNTNVNINGSNDWVLRATPTDSLVLRDATAGANRLVLDATGDFDFQDGNLETNGGVTAESVTFDTTASPSLPYGGLSWNSSDGVLQAEFANNFTARLPLDIAMIVFNLSGSAISKGDVVFISTASGNRPRIVLADASSKSTAEGEVAVAAQDIANGATGYVLRYGVIEDIDTSAFSLGAEVYLSTTAGALTATKPTPPDFPVSIGRVINSDASGGKLFVDVRVGSSFSFNGDVNITSVQDNDVLKYSSSNGRWENATARVQYAVFREKQNSGVSGGTFTSGAWRTRGLNETQSINSSNISRSGSAITLQVGTYYISAFATAYRCEEHQTRFYDTTNTNTVIEGSSQFNGITTPEGSNNSWLAGVITVSGSAATFELQHRCERTKTINGLGVTNSFGEAEIYSQVYVEEYI